MNQATLPQPIADHMARSEAARRRPAWLFVGPDGNLLDAGGDLRTYGLSRMGPGTDVCVTAPYLDGLLPVGTQELHLPWIAMEDGRFADVYVLPGDGADWVLLLDATDAAERASPFQQRRNEESLQLERSLFRSIRSFFGGAECLALKQLSSGTYRIVEAAPPWATGELVLEQVVRPQNLFPYLRAFLPEIEAFFEANEAGTLRLDPWTQHVRVYGEVELEAYAVVLEPPCRALFIRPIGQRARARQSLLQSAREQRLLQEGLSRDIERKDVIAHCIVHDLKGPLSCMKGYLQLAQSDDVDAAQRREFLAKALDQCARQRDLLGEVLDVFAAEQRASVELDPVSVSLAAVAGRVADQFSGGYAQAHRHLEVELPEDGAFARVQCDDSRAERVFANLLDNALRHTPRGGVVRVVVRRDDDAVLAWVENDGDAVPNDRRPGLFDRFTTSTAGGGSVGLGLFFCRITLERWGGTIQYHERPQGGSRFEMRLPAADGPAQA